MKSKVRFVVIIDTFVFFHNVERILLGAMTHIGVSGKFGQGLVDPCGLGGEPRWSGEYGKLVGSLAAESLAYYQGTPAHLDYPVCGNLSARASCFKTTDPFSELGIQHWDFPGRLHYAAVAMRMSHGLIN